MLTIYAAGPIDLGADIPQWRTDLLTQLSKYGVSTTMFDPSSSYKIASVPSQIVDHRRGRFIEDVNRVALENADIVVVCLPNGITSIGTPIEIDMAHKLAKQIYLLTDIPNGKSVYLDNRVPSGNWFNWVENGISNIAGTIAELAESISDDVFRSGKSETLAKIIDNDDTIYEDEYVEYIDDWQA